MAFWDSLVDTAEKGWNTWSSGVRDVVEDINPWDGESKRKREGDRLLELATRQYDMKEKARQAAEDASPEVGEGGWQKSPGLEGGSRAAGIYIPEEHGEGMDTRMRVNEYGKRGANVMRHETLHAIWDQMDDVNRNKFVKIANDAAQDDPVLAEFIKSKLAPYKQNKYTVVPYKEESLFSRPYPMRNEIHAYLPEYYDRSRIRHYEDGSISRDREMPETLRNYYSNYYDPDRYEERELVAQEIRNMLSGGRTASRQLRPRWGRSPRQ